MQSIRQIIGEIHRKSLWQVVSVYVAGSWGVLEAVEVVIESTALPAWVRPMALVLLMIGLPMVAATAFVQDGIRTRPDVGDETDGTGESAAPGDGERGRSGDHVAASPAHGTLHLLQSSAHLLTWRNTVFAGVGAFAVLGMMSVGWFVRERFLPANAHVDPAGSAGLLPGALESRPAAPPAAIASAADSTSAVENTSGTEIRSAADDAGRVELAESEAQAPRISPSTGAREAFLASRAAADAARTAARRSRAHEADPTTAAEADSLWDAAGTAAIAGRYEEGRGLVEVARDRYEGATRRAAEIQTSDLAALRLDAEGLRSVADPGAPEFASALALQETAARHEGAGDLVAAIEATKQARDLYEAVQRTHLQTSEQPAAPEPPSPREVVLGTLTRLSRALAAEDLAEVRRVWVSLSPGQASNFGTFFARWSDIRVTLEPDWATLVADGEGVRVSVRTTWRFVEGGRTQEQAPFVQSLRFAERQGGWVIVGS